MGNHSKAMVGVIAFALFLDYFLYGLLLPLMAHSHAALKGEGHLALLYGVYAVSVLLVTPVFGYLGDRIGGRSSMLCGVVLSLIAILLLSTASSLPLLIVGKFCQGAGSSALWTSCLAMLAMTYVERRVEILGYAFSGGTFGSVTGPITGGLLYHAGGYRLPFLITGIALALAGILIALVVPAGGIRPGEAIGFRALLFNRSMMIPAIAVALAAFSVGIIEPLLPVRLARFGATSMAIGIIFTVSASIYGLSAPLVGRVSSRMPIQKVITLGTIAMAFTLPLLALFKGVVLVGITVCLINVWYAFMLNPASAELGNVVDRSGLSCYSACYAVFNIFYSIGMLGTATLVSAAVHWLSLRGVLLCAAIILLLFVPFLIKASPKIATTAASEG